MTWEPHGFSKRVRALQLVVYQLSDGARWEVTGELFEATGFCGELDNAKATAEDAADAIDRLESLVSGGEPWGNRASAGRGSVRRSSNANGSREPEWAVEELRQALGAKETEWALAREVLESSGNTAAADQLYDQIIGLRAAIHIVASRESGAL